MVHAEDGSLGRDRRWRSTEESQIVKLTLELGGSVAEMARALGVNASPTKSERG